MRWLVAAASSLTLTLASSQSPGQSAGPYGILALPSQYQSHRISFRDAIAGAGETEVARMQGAGCLRHLWLTLEHLAEHPELGLRVALRIYVDGSDVPSVDVPLGPFFGIHHGHAPADVVSPYLTVTARGGLNAYFPMPFERGMRITLYNESGAERGVWFQADYHRYEAGSLHEQRRFRAAYRRVNRAERLGEPYHLGHSEGGEGVLVGVSIGMRVLDRFDAWYHNGGDLLLIDGRTAGAHLLSGIGGEDFFGTAWGQQAFSGGPVGSAYYDESPEAPLGDPTVVFSGYRFFDRDPISFRDSFWYDFGTLANDVASVLYWYETGSGEAAEAAATDGTGEGSELIWSVCGPFRAERPGDFERREFPEEGVDLGRTAPANFGQYARASELAGSETEPAGLAHWITGVVSRHRFVDLTPHFRPRLLSNGGLPKDVSAYAATVVEAARQGRVRIRVGHDDPFKLWVNGRLAYEGGPLAGFQTRELEVDLLQGKNELLVKAANHDNTNFRAWVFSLDVLDR